MKKIMVVGAIIVDNNNKIFCAQRGPGRTLENLWEFPGGKIEEGETDIQALKRELAEELKISVLVKEVVFERTQFEYDFGIVDLSTFICHLQNGKQPILSEHIASKWLSIKELETLDWAPDDEPAVKKLMRVGVLHD